MHKGENRLVAYVLTSLREPFDEAPVREKMRSELPDYMCPSLYMAVERFPLTPSGKVDRRALPEPVLERSAVSIRFEPPQNALETSISLIWQEVLGIGAVGRSDRFFDLGGTSLLMIRVYQKLEKTLARRFPITLLFQYPTVAALAAHMDEQVQPNDSRQQEVQGRAARQRQAMARQAGARSAMRRRDA
jgi:acyl carrier protein